MECNNCGSHNIELYIVIPEVTEGTIIGKCKACGSIIKQGKSVFK